MAITLVRGLIIYLLVMICVRLMGKRQIGDLQPSDLVITILLSEIAAIPMQDNDLPLINSIAAVIMLVAIEILISYVSLRFRRLRHIMDGNAVMIIKNGKIDQKQLKKLRFTVDDLMGGLRLKDVFDINDVDYAYVETNGSLSVLVKAEKLPLTYESTGMGKAQGGLSCIVISGGKVVDQEFPICGLSEKKLQDILDNEGVTASEVLLMTAKDETDYTVIRSCEKIT